MKILIISDKVDDFIYNNNIKEHFSDIELILSCGDLPLYYLDFIVSNLKAPLYYVLGNHDFSINPKKNFFDTLDFNTKYSINAYQNYTYQQYKYIEYKTNQACGCENIDNKVISYKNLLIGGLEGSYKYNANPLQYTDNEMNLKILKMKPALYYNKLRFKKYIDILITHAPPFNIHDKEDLCHRGFKSYIQFMKKYKPRFLIHGHTHIYDINQYKDVKFFDTSVINVYGYRIMEI